MVCILGITGLKPKEFYSIGVDQPVQIMAGEYGATGNAISVKGVV